MPGFFSSYKKWFNEEFWPFYLSEHQNPTSRSLHFGASGLGLFCLAATAVTASPLFLAAGLIVGYGGAWTGHLKHERNKPATFKMPFASLLGDYRMFFAALGGTLNEQMKGYGLDTSGIKPAARTVLPFHVWRCKDLIPADKLDGQRIHSERRPVPAAPLLQPQPQYGLVPCTARLVTRVRNGLKAGFAAAAQPPVMPPAEKPAEPVVEKPAEAQKQAAQEPPVAPGP
jgi:hypothetical protein